MTPEWTPFEPGPFGLRSDRNRRYRLRLGRYPAAAEVIDAFVGDRPTVALDAGVGKGRLGQISCAPNLRWVGLDRSPERLRKARAIGAYDLVRGDLQAMPFDPESFDVVVCIQVLEHFEHDEARAIAEQLGRLVAPGGLLLLSVPIFPRSWIAAKAGLDRLRTALGGNPLRGSSHLMHYSLATARALTPSGFTTTDVQGVRAFSLPFKLLEDYRWWYRLHRWYGRRFPGWTIEVNVTARKL